MSKNDNHQEEVTSKALKAMNKAKKPGTMAGLLPHDVESLIVAYGPQIAQALPRHLTAERVIQQATTLIARNPSLAECTVTSLIGATMQASILGFQPVAALGQCYFVPFKNKGEKEVQFIIGYKGYIDLARRSNNIKAIFAYAVYEGDEFEFELGLNPGITHKPAEDAERGKLIYAYAVAHFTNGGYAFEVVTRDEVMKRKKASQSANSSYSPWNKWEAEMWVKTAIKKLSKWLPLSTELVEQFTADEAVIKPENFTEGEINLDEVEFVDTDTGEIIEEEPKEEQPKKEEVPA